VDGLHKAINKLNESGLDDNTFPVKAAKDKPIAAEAEWVHFNKVLPRLNYITYISLQVILMSLKNSTGKKLLAPIAYLRYCQFITGILHLLQHN